MDKDQYKNLIEFFINKKIEEKKQLHEPIYRDFFESNSLKESVEDNVKAFITKDKFETLYKIVLCEVRTNVQTNIRPSSSLKDEDTYLDWLTESRISTIGWDSENITTYRDRYLHYLKKIGRTQTTIDETKRSSFEIIRKVKDPQSTEPFLSRGLVVGNVQSGKTANFNAVINSAIDVGYQLVIVFSGIMEDLRKQTQKRIEKEVVGKFVSDGEFIGVAQDGYSFGPRGELSDVTQINLLTSEETDFKKALKDADPTLNNKYILICKKNTSVLKNLLVWLEAFRGSDRTEINVPFLIVDDEADNASLNNSGYKGEDYDPTTINGHLRALLRLFKKSAYIGYTATPFANVLQDQNPHSGRDWVFNVKGKEYRLPQIDNLFPSDFIELLFPPSNYIGAKHYFKTRISETKQIEPLIPLVVNDHIEAFPYRVFTDTLRPTTQTGKGTIATKKEHNFPEYIPDSLKLAIQCYILSIAVRISRKPLMIDSKLYQPHNTMLIHISRYTTWQNRTKKLVEEYVEELASRIKGDSLSEKGSIYDELEKIWNEHYAYTMDNIWNYLPSDYDDGFLAPKTFSEIKPLLSKAIQDIRVNAINSSDEGTSLYYPSIEECRKNPRENERKYIAIGGNRLSRGFTLEGLSINYFVRNTDLSDTLLQMGRWFGYRPGYIDCCKLFTTTPLLEKFDLTTLTIEDLEQRFIDMNQQPYPHNKPLNFALRIIKHPGVLKVTRGQMLKNTKTVKYSYSDHLIQTTQFKINNEIISRAWKDFRQHITSIKENFAPIYPKGVSKNPSYWEYQTQNVQDVFDILALPNTFDIHKDKTGISVFGDVIKFIKECNEQGKLSDWSIVIKASGSGGNLIQDFPFSPLNMTKRQGPSPKGRWQKEFKDHQIFTAGGDSKNIFNGGNDFKIRLSETQIKSAEKQFRKERLKDYRVKFPDETNNALIERVNNTTIPEKVYRQAMSPKEGVLIIYLIDTKEIFKNENTEITELEHISKTVDLSIPLIGYALGIPPIQDESICGEYHISRFYNEFKSDEPEENFEPEEINE